MTIKQGEHRGHATAALKAAFAALLVLAAAGILVLLSVLMGRYVTLALLLFILAGLITALRLGRRDVGAGCLWTWTVLLLALPLAGLALYFFWGPWRKTALPPSAPPPHKDYEYTRSADYIKRLEEGFPTWSRTARLLLKGDWMVYKNTAVTYFPDGDAYFADVQERLERAEHFIFIEYSRLSEGRLWDRIFPILRNRAAQGVEIKFLFDGMYSAGCLSPSMIAAMRQCGMEVMAYRPAGSFADRLRRDRRDRRCILVIDADYAYTGAASLTDACANLVRRHGRWKDGAVLLEGEGAWGLTRQFLHLWEQLGGRLGNEYDYYRPHGPVKGEGWCQPFGDSPDHPAGRRTAEDLCLQAVAAAKQFLYLTAPDFAPGDSLLRALAVAADSGVDVRIMLPGNPVQKSGQIRSGAFFATLLERGVRIYTYTPGYLHSSLLVADGEMAVVCSANPADELQGRHHLCGTVLYGMSAVEHILRDLQVTLEQCREIRPDQWHKRGIFRRWAEALLRFFHI